MKSATISPPGSWVASLSSGANVVLNVASFAKTPLLLYAAFCDGYAWLQEPAHCESAPAAAPIVAHIALAFAGSTLWFGARLAILWWERRGKRVAELPGTPYRSAPCVAPRPVPVDRATSWAVGCDAVVWFAALMLVVMPLVYPESLRTHKGPGGIVPCQSFTRAEELRKAR